MVQKKKINIDLEQDVYEKVKHESIVEDRSVKNMIEIIIKKYFLNREQAKVIYRDIDGREIETKS